MSLTQSWLRLIRAALALFGPGLMARASEPFTLWLPDREEVKVRTRLPLMPPWRVQHPLAFCYCVTNSPQPRDEAAVAWPVVA